MLASTGASRTAPTTDPGGWTDREADDGGDPRRRRGRAPVDPVAGARQAGRPVRRQVPDHRLHAVELRQLGHRRRRRPDPVQPALAQRPHRPRPAVGPRPQPRRRQAAPAVHRPRPRRRVVPRHGRRGAAQPQRHRARRRGHGRRPRRRPHLQDGLPAVRGRPPAPAGRRDDRGPPRAARRGVADGHPRARRERPRHRVAGEAQAAQERPRLDGRLRLLEEGAPALAVARTASTSARTSSRRCSTAARASSAIATTATGRTSARSSRTGRPTWRSSTTTPSSTCTTRTGSSTPAPRNGRRPRSGRPPRSTAA